MRENFIKMLYDNEVGKKIQDKITIIEVENLIKITIKQKFKNIEL